MAIQEVELLVVGFGPLLSQRDHRWVQMAHDGVHARVTGRGPALRGGNPRGLARNGSDAAARLLQGQSFDEALEVGRHNPVVAPISAGLLREPDHATPAIACHPAARCAEWHTLLLG